MTCREERMTVEAPGAIARLFDNFTARGLAGYRFPDPCFMKVESALVARKPVDEYETSSSAFAGADCS